MVSANAITPCVDGQCSLCYNKCLRIRDIWYGSGSGSVSLTNGSGFGSGFGSCYFCHWPTTCTVKNENKIFLIYKEIQNGAVAKSYMTNGLMGKYLRLSPYIRRPFLIHIWLCNCSTQNFLIYEEKLIFFFIGVATKINFFLSILLITFWRYIYIIFNNKKS